MAQNNRAWAWPSKQPPPFVPAPRMYDGNMCGVRVPGLPPVPGGAADASLVLSWFYDRYGDSDRARIRDAWLRYPDVLVSWPDSQAVGHSPQQFVAMCRELIAYGFLPNVFLSAKPESSDQIRTLDETIANMMLVAPLLVGIVPRMCIGWELSLWLSPTDVQILIDTFTPMFVAADCKCYVHFQQGYGSFQQPGEDFASFWNLQVGKLTGLFHQKVLTQDQNAYWYDSGGLVDILIRFAGNYGVVPDSGFGHPFDLVALEITASFQFDWSMSESDGDWWGDWANAAPGQSGPSGMVKVMGSGNGD